MPESTPGITIRLYSASGDTVAGDAAVAVELTCDDGSAYRGAFTPPYPPETWPAILRALEPGFDIAGAGDATRAALRPLGDLTHLPETVGQALGDALFASPNVREGFDVALHLAARERQPLAVTLRFAAECHALAGLPWELLRHDGRFLVADSSIALSRYPESPTPPTPVEVAQLPLRVLLVLAEPLDASPIFPERAREQLVHGLRALDEEGAVIVDELRPPTFDTLIEAVTNGEYHLLIFYGHGVYDPDQGGLLLFEDAFGGKALVKATELGAVLRNTSVRLVMLGACQSAQIGETGGLWSGTAPALVRAGVPLAIGMQVSMLVTAAQTFIRQFALSLAAGETVSVAVADARKPLIRAEYGQQWFVPVLYGRPSGDDRLFDATTPTPPELLDLRRSLKAHRAEIVELEGRSGIVYDAAELADLRAAKCAFAQDRALLARHTPGGYTQVVSPLYGVPTNPVFVGRAKAVQEVSHALHGQHPVVIWGTGGIGKTALAAEVAARQSWRFPGGVLWLDCRGSPALDTLLNRMGAFCGIQGVEGMEPEQRKTAVRHALAGLEDRVLLVWDNAEDIAKALNVMEFIEQLPRNCQSLFTTRPRPEDDYASKIHLGPLTDEAMVDTFVIRAKRDGVLIPYQDWGLLLKMVAFLEGHPLALRWLVPLLLDAPIDEIWNELREQGLEPLQAAFEISWQTLGTSLQRLFSRLSVFTIPFESSEAEALGGNRRELRELRRRALVDFDSKRYSYHQLVRQFAYEKLREVEDPRPVHRLAAEYLQSKITDQKQGGTPEEILESVDQWEYAEAWEEFAQNAIALVDSLARMGFWTEIQVRLERAVIATQAHLNRPQLVAILQLALGNILYNQAEWDQAIAIYEQGLERFESADDTRWMAEVWNQLAKVYASKGELNRANVILSQNLETVETEEDEDSAYLLGNLGMVYWKNGQWDRAIAIYKQLLEIFEQNGDTNALAQTYGNLGMLYTDKNDWDRAIKMLERGLEIFTRVGNLDEIAKACGNLGTLYLRKNEWNQAIETYERGLEIFKQVSDQHGIAKTQGGLGLAYLQKGELNQAIEMMERSLEILEDIGDTPGAGETLAYLGYAYLQMGDWRQSIVKYEQALKILEGVGSIHEIAEILNNLGSIYWQKGKVDQAITMFERGLAALERTGNSDKMAGVLYNLGHAYRKKGELDRAIVMYQRSQEANVHVGDAQGIASTWMDLGRKYAHIDEWDRAIVMYERSLQASKRVGDTHSMASAWGNLGNIYLHLGEWDQAITMYEQCLAIFERVGDARSMTFTYMNLGNVYLKMEKWDQADAMYKRSLMTNLRLGNIHGMAITLRGLGVLCMITSNLVEARAYLTQAYLYFGQIGADDEQKMAAQDLVKACGGSVKAAGDYIEKVAAEILQEMQQAEDAEPSS